MIKKQIDETIKKFNYLEDVYLYEKCKQILNEYDLKNKEYENYLKYITEKINF